jgi:hypothetical protein
VRIHGELEHREQICAPSRVTSPNPCQCLALRTARGAVPLGLRCVSLRRAWLCKWPLVQVLRMDPDAGAPALAQAPASHGEWVNPYDPASAARLAVDGGGAPEQLAAPASDDVEPASEQHEGEEEEEEEETGVIGHDGGAPQPQAAREGARRASAFGATAAPDAPARRKAPASNSRCHSITYDMLAAHFHLSVVDAALRLGVSRTTLKTVCRQHGIKRWPKRALVKMDVRDPEAIMRTALSLQPYPWQGPQQKQQGTPGAKPGVKAPKKHKVSPGLQRPAAPRDGALQAPRGGGLMDAVHQGAVFLVATRACPWMR